MSKKNLLEDGTVLTLGLVGAVAAVGALASRRGSRAMVSEGIYKDISLPADELGAGHHGSRMLTVDVNTQDEDWGKPWLVTVGSGYSGHHFLVFGSSEDSALAHAIETAVVTAPGWTARPGDKHLEEMLREYDGEGYATDDGSVYLGHFDSLHIRRLDNNVRSLLQRHGVSLEGEGSGNRGYRSRGSRATAMVGDRFEWPRTNSYSFEEYRRNAGIRDMDEFRADLRRKMSDPRSDSSQNYAGVEHTPGAVPEYNRKPHATMKAAVAAATKLAKGGGRPVVHSVGYSGRIYTRYVDERGFGESLLEEFGSDRYPRPLPRSSGSRATTRSSTDFHATLSTPTGQVIREQRLDHPFFSGSHDTYDNKVLDMALEMVTRAPVGSIITIRGDGHSWRFKVVNMSGGHLGVRKMRDLKKRTIKQKSRKG